MDGREHFEQVKNWTYHDENQKTDKYKMKCSNDNGYSIIRILQEDAYWDKYDWLKELKENITKLSKKKKVQNIFMCEKNEYLPYLN